MAGLCPLNGTSCDVLEDLSFELNAGAPGEPRFVWSTASSTQSLGAGAKLVFESIGFGLFKRPPMTENGGLDRFAHALEDDGRYGLMRVAVWVVFGRLLPLGSNVLPTVIGIFRHVASDYLVSNGSFSVVGAQVPGDTPDQKHPFMIDSLDSPSMGPWTNSRGFSVWLLVAWPASPQPLMP